MKPVTFTIPGRIGGKQRVGRNFQQGHHAFNPKKTVSLEAVVRYNAAEQMVGRQIIEGACAFSIGIFRLYPKSWSKKKKANTIYVTGRPDCDNQIKLISDALNGVVWRDDAQVAVLNLDRRYTDEREYVSVSIIPLEGV